MDSDMSMHASYAFKHTCWGILLLFLAGGVADCSVVVTVSGPHVAKVGSNVTLNVFITGATRPTIVWAMGDIPVVTWTLGSSSPPDILDPGGVLSIERDGSLSFHNVLLNYSATYTIRVVELGVGSNTSTFTLRVFDDIRNVSVSTEPVKAVEGASTLTLTYSSLQGEATEVKWFFNGAEIKNGAHYVISGNRLMIRGPTRNDTGRYTLVLKNPFSSETVHKNISVHYGPERPVLEVHPPKAFFVSGDSVMLSCHADGDPSPIASWVFGGLTLPAQAGMLNLTSIQSSQSGVYICVMLNNETGDQLEKSVTIQVYERPSGDPMCSVTGVNGNQDLQYRCQWAGGTPEAQLSFPVLNATSSGSGDFNLTRKPSQDLNGKEVTCVASHPFLQRNCSVTARGPADFQPLVSSMVDADKKLVITIACASTSLPVATVTWSKGNQILTSGGRYQISSNTTLLFILDFHLNSTELGTYTCNAVNILGNQTNDVSVLGPTVSDLGLFPNQEGTMVTLTWETPRTSVITGFEVQMMGPSLLPSPGGRQRRKRATNEFGTIQEKPSSARSTNISGLDPKATYRFRVIPTAGATRGQPSKELRAGPGGGLSGPAIAGIAAGIPCGILLILIIIALIILCVVWRRKRRQTRYPVSRAVEKVVATQPNLNTPHTLLTGGLKTSAGPPDYSVHLASERSSTLPSVVSPPPVRMATTV
ncbi:V-set and immunoglobulin domain-containing protein 10-like isoform X1 [Megalops cyprinoides]|uniref:V-set and immunoglobulin domain-containing protein 10-like isoform X1 n=1 Tax=Megalops cyprinoides TaxID=118141 RepID=UPI001864B404|nr:V-set and immunoglobulin domain-containing protein 10-like isoform X1 [Megalops cyprinoides]